MANKNLLYAFVFLFVTSCCDIEPESAVYPFYNRSGNIAITFQIRDSTSSLPNAYRKSVITSVDWLGAAYTTTVYDSSAFVNIDIKSTQTRFAIKHERGIDTVTFNYDWKDRYDRYCKVERDYTITSVTNKRDANVSSESNWSYIIRLK